MWVIELELGTNDPKQTLSRAPRSGPVFRTRDRELVVQGKGEWATTKDMCVKRQGLCVFGGERCSGSSDDGGLSKMAAC